MRGATDSPLVTLKENIVAKTFKDQRDHKTLFGYHPTRDLVARFGTKQQRATARANHQRKELQRRDALESLLSD